MKLKDNSNDPYFQKISEYLYSQFPNVATPTDCELLEILTTILVGTKEIRYGSLPSPESLVTIRKTIREAIENGNAIPVLVPWGSIKAVNFSDDLDVAELMAVQRLVAVNDEVKKFFEPGLDIVIRVEDTSGYQLFSIDVDEEIVSDRVTKYSENFKQLVDILSNNTIRVIKESQMDKAIHFNSLQDEYYPLFLEYILRTTDMIKFDPAGVKNLPSYKALEQIGWKGIISHEQRQFYYDSYSRNYTDQSLNQSRLALYMAQALTRHNLHMSGKQDYWKSFIQITFVQPVKGLPEGYHNNCLYYRTIPMSQGRTHICPWRAKGYLKIGGSNVCAKITSANDPIDLLDCRINVAGNTSSVELTIRYLIED